MKQRPPRPTYQGLSLVIPAYNEEGRLPRTLAEIRRYRETFVGVLEVIVADDGSEDGTAALVRRSIAEMPYLQLVELPHRGKGSAVRAGVLAARQPWVVVCDADLSMPVEQVDRFVAALAGGAQIAVGSREMQGAQRYGEPARRHLMGRIFNMLVRALVVNGFDDTQCGFKGFSLAAAHQIFSRQRLNGFSFDVEVLYLARKRGYALREVAIDWHFDADSRVRPGVDALKMTLDLLHIRLLAFSGAYRSRSAEAPATSLETRKRRI